MDSPNDGGSNSEKGEPSKAKGNLDPGSDDEDDTLEISQEAVFNQIRNLINENKTKLWLPPYYEPGIGPSESHLMELAATLETSLGIDVLVVLKGLRTLQRNAVDKLAARAQLSMTGRMSLKIKLAKTFKSPFEKQSISVDSNSTGKFLAGEIADLIGCDANQLMLISGGKTIKENEMLSAQDLKAGATVMVVKINRNEESWSVLQEQKELLQTAKNDARLLGKSNQLVIQNQDGKSLDIPTEERNALILAMSLHDKGRAAIKKNNFDLALIFLLEASREYESCRAEILKVADNYGLLNLDIVWCYLKLGNISELPNAEERLAECEKSFQRSYGQNFERLTAVRGANNAEEALIVRLRLLKAIVAFHSGHRNRALDLFQNVQSQLQRLDVPEDMIDEVAAQGFSRCDARVALRAVGNKVPDAVRFAQEAEEKRQKLKRDELEKTARRLRLGMTADGSFVNLGYLDTIIGYGYSEDLAAAALRQTNNNIDSAMDALYNDIETLTVIVSTMNSITPEMIKGVTDMGFTSDAAKRELIKSQGNVEEAISNLTSEAGKSAESQEAKRQKREARERMDETLDEEDGYLDIPLNEEKDLLDKYIKILRKEPNK